MALLSFLLVVFSYMFLVFFLSRFFVPFLGFRKEPLPEKIPEEMKRDIEMVKRASRTKEEFLRNAYEFLKKRFHGSRRRTITQLFGVFDSDIGSLYSRKGFHFCTQLNQIVRVFLAGSGFFQDEDIKRRHTFYMGNIHQYLEVRLNENWVKVDLWAAYLGVPLGERRFLW